MIVFSGTLKSVALLCYVVLVLFTIRSKTEPRLRRFFLVYMSGMIYWQAISLAITFAREAATALLLYNLLFAGSGMFNVLFLPLSRAFLNIRGQRLLVFLAYAMCAVMLAGGILGMQFREVYMGRAGYYVPRFDNWAMYSQAVVGYFLWGVGVFNLVRGLVREKSPFQVNRITYMLLGALVVIIGTASNFTPLRDYPVDISANLASALVIGYAVVRHRLIDIRVVLVRSLFYSVLTGALIAVYLGIIFGSESLLKAGLGYSGPVYGIVAIGILALVFLPLRNSLQKVLDRLFFRQRADYQAATQGFSRALSVLYEPSLILDLVWSTLADTVRPGFVSVSLFREDTRSFVAERSYGAAPPAAEVGEQGGLVRWLRREGKPLVREEALMSPPLRSIVEEHSALFRDADVSVVVPILLKDRLLGMLCLGGKLAGTLYGDEDLGFLTTVASQTATAMERSRVYGEIQRRLSEQTLLFILSERFRGSTDFDSVMRSVVRILKSFLSCEQCALVYFEREGRPVAYALDPLSQAAAEVAIAASALSLAGLDALQRGQPLSPGDVREAVARQEGLSAGEHELAASLLYLPLIRGEDVLGVLVLPGGSADGAGGRQDTELLRTIRAIISQGIVLHRAIVDLVNVKTYNENILNSLNDMGDTLVILDPGGTIRAVNRATCALLGYREDELVGRHVRLITGDAEPLFTGEGFRSLLAGGPVANRELIYRTRDGAAIPMLFSGSLMTGEDGTSREVVGIARDITEHRKAEESAKNLLLVKEIHHRIKNNLQVISSLLYLQSGYVEDEKTREMFRESQNRVRSMALLHEKLYQGRSPAGVAFSEYVRDLTRNLFLTYGVKAGTVGLSIEMGGITLGMDTAVPAGLIINELVSNALKHAFPGGRPGSVRIELRPAEGGAGESWYLLTVSDDGAGFPEGLDHRATDSLGLKLVCTLTEQLSGTVDLERGEGTRFLIRLREL